MSRAFDAPPRAPAFSAFDALVTALGFTVDAGATSVVPLKLRWEQRTRL